MNERQNMLLEMLQAVAVALPESLRDRVAFLGGSTTVLLLTDALVKEGVRHTQDVDLIINAEGRGNWFQLVELLRQHGFKEDIESGIVCRFRLGGLMVDVMPDDDEILGFTNRWYRAALESSQPHALSDGVEINLVTPAYFVATKLEAWKGRGNNDPLSSHDLEDILTLVDGRESLHDEIAQAPKDVIEYIAEEFSRLLDDPRFEYAIDGNIADQGRADLVWERWQAIAELASGQPGSG